MTGHIGPMTPLRSLCNAHGVSRRGLAVLSGLSRQTLYNIEADAASASWDTIHKIAAALGEDPAYVRDVLDGNAEVRQVAA